MTFEIGDRVYYFDNDAVVVGILPESNSYKIYCSECGEEACEVYEEKLTAKPAKTVDDLAYYEIRKLLFDDDIAMEEMTLTAMIIERLSKTEIPELLNTFDTLCGSADAFRAALIEKYRDTLERAMND